MSLLQGNHRQIQPTMMHVVTTTEMCNVVTSVLTGMQTVTADLTSSGRGECFAVKRSKYGFKNNYLSRK